MEISEVKMRDIITTANRLKDRLREAISVRKHNIQLAKKLSDDIDESCYKAHAAKVGGATGAAVGSVLGIVGFGLAFVTFGASLGLSICGAIIGGAGATTMACADVGHFVFNIITKKNLQRSFELEKEKLQDIDKLSQQLNNQVNSFAETYKTSIEREAIMGHIKMAITSGKGWYDSFKMGDACFDIGRAINKAATATGTLWSSMSFASRAAAATGAIFDIIALPLDIGCLAYSSYQVHQYRTREQHPKENCSPTRLSKTATKIDEVVVDMEQQKYQLIEYYKKLGGE